MRYLITISYDGTDFSGYQKQPKERTVQSELEKALKEINGGKKVDVHASGRTDAGVHALNQKVHFDLETKITPDKLIRGLNSLLPNDIYVKDVKEVPEDFHARFSAIGKEYIYKLNMGEYNPLERNYVYQHNKKLDVIEMERAMKYLEGEHNFKSFTKTDEEKDISRLEITIHEGKNRQVRRMCESVGRRVIALHRSKIGNIGVKDIELGKWRYLKDFEVKTLIGK